MENKLVNCPLFHGIHSKDIRLLLEKVDYKILQYDKNEMVVTENQLCDHLFIILTGTVRGEMTDYSGKVIKIEDIDTLRPLAPAFLFGIKNRYPVSIITNDMVEIASFSKESVLKIFNMNQIFLINFLNMISNRAQFLSQKIKFLSFQTIKGKLAHYLLQFDKNKESKSFILPVSQQQLAELFGVTRPALGRAVRELDNEGFIEARGKEFRIINYQKLSLLLK